MTLKDDGVELTVAHGNPQFTGEPKETIGLHRLPRSSIFVIWNEFCERFSYYGMKALLAVYFVKQLGMSERSSTEATALFIVACYVCPVLGAYLSDAHWGRYTTIVWLSLVHLVGNALLAFVALLPNGMSIKVAGVAMALGLVALGTGGIKPCVSAFGGDQIVPPVPEVVQLYFSFFYFSINAGSLSSSVLTPVVRASLGYSFAFALPAVLMAFALLAIVHGRKSYRYVPPQGDIFTKTVGAMMAGINGWRHGEVPYERCMDAAIHEYGQEMVNDVRQLLKVLVLFLPAPIFWSLFDQQGSRWTFQATDMDCQLTPGFKVQPEQVQSLNAFLILALIPLFEKVIYPIADYLVTPKIARNAVYRMASGMFLAAGAFGLAATVQTFIDERGEGKVSVGWQVPQYVIMTSGEILFSITGLEFAFSQAPESLKSVVQSFWLLTTAAGNLVTVILLESLTKSMTQFQEFCVFALGCFLAMCWLIYLARHDIAKATLDDEHVFERADTEGSPERSEDRHVVSTTQSPFTFDNHQEAEIMTG